MKISTLAFAFSVLWLASALYAVDEATLRFDSTDGGSASESAPVEKPWRTVELDPDYGGHWVVTGDLDGDGRAEIVSARNVDQDDVHYTSAVVAQRLDSAVLWRWGDPKVGRKKLHHDVACQIHDWNGDGRNEVILATRGFIVELDGASGRERRRLPIPPQATDCLVFARLSGKGRASDVLVKTRYTQIWALDPRGELLWTVEMPGGFRTAHQPLPVDLDNDGLDEILAGYTMLNHDGSVRWTYRSERVDLARGHVDCARLLRGGATPADHRLVLTCCGARNIVLLDGEGKTLWEVSGHHFQSVDIGTILPDVAGPQIVVDIDHRPRGESPLWLLDRDGKLRGRIVANYSRSHDLIDWTGDGNQQFVIADARGVFDRHGQRIATLEADSRGFVLIPGDMTGDGVPDITLTTASRVHVYRNRHGRPAAEPVAPGCGVNFTLY